MSSKSITKTIKQVWKTHGNDICTYFGVASLLGATVTSVFATIKAVRKYDELTEEKGEPLTKSEVIKNTYMYYIPTVATASVGALCVISANVRNGKQNAALATACALSDSKYRHFKDEVVEKFGKKKTDEVENEAKKKELDSRTPVEVVSNGNGEHTTKCFDYRMGRYFWSDIATIERAMIDFNKQLVRDDVMTLNDFYDMLGLPQAEDASYIGWTSEDVLNEQIEIDLSTCIDQTKTPCLVIDFTISPHALR